MPGPIPQHSGAGFYSPGGIESEYERLHNKPELPSVAPPSGSSADEQAAAQAFIQSGFFDEDAPDVLRLVQGGRFDPPFTVTLMQREGMREFRSDAGTKREANYKLCKETVRDPADLLRIQAGIVGEIYKPLNNMTLEFQLMLYIAARNGALYDPKAVRASDKGKIVAGLTDEE